jgi:hypothetical protein
VTPAKYTGCISRAGVSAPGYNSVYRGRETFAIAKIGV